MTETKAPLGAYDQLKNKIQEANPEILEVCAGEDKPHYCPNCGGNIGRPIRLADVLLANAIQFKTIEWPATQSMTKTDELDVERVSAIVDFWNLKDDNLDHQSGECKEFLIKLLVNA